MLSFLPRLDYCWKCEFDRKVFIKKYISKHRAKNFILRETKESNVFDKNCIQENVFNIQMKIVDLDESWLSR